MKVKLTETELVKLIEKVLLEKKEKECPKGMYWCRKSKACKPKSEKLKGDTVDYCGEKFPEKDDSSDSDL